jgi:phosphopantetheinyl transferase
VPLDPTLWESRLSEQIGVACVVAAAEFPEPLSSLTHDERRRVESFGSSPRAEAYRRGRSALRALLARLGENPATSFGFPHPRFSITHSGSAAIAFGIRAGQTQAGAGIDYEASARVSRKAERFFLRSSECRWLRLVGRPAARKQRLRLWTVKEALFKADLENANTFLRDYATSDPSATSGWAKPSVPSAWPEAWRYASLEVGGGFLTAAVRVQKRNS